MKLRLLLFSACNRSCAGCCNKDVDLDALPLCADYSGYESIFLTGGEPMLNPDYVIQVIKHIRTQTDAPIYLYTARPMQLERVIGYLAGVTLTLHEQSDVVEFSKLNKLPGHNRLNVFSNVDLTGVDTTGWIVKSGITWIKDAPLPNGEVFMRLSPLN